MKKCRVCKKPFEPKYNTLQRTCSPKCALQDKKARETLDKHERKEHRARKEALKTKPELMAEAQDWCNRFIRTRDKGRSCISCGRNTGAKMNAGHYRSVGACPELRFHPFNIWLQCEHCNSWKSGNAIDYRINLVNEIGTKNVEWLEGPHQAQNWTHDELREIKAYYKQRIKELDER